ncbi:MAG: cache domain-containing protein [Arcobacter sp.]|uniref:cache domain-containing protein n=1 Tax=Arcobacter sp. TaxID=1872629 RepID=UPI003B0071DC
MKLSNLILKAIFFTALVSTFLGFIINTIFEYNNFQKEKEHIKKEFIKQKKSEVKREVNKAFNYILYHESMIKSEVKRKLRNRVYDAYSIAYKIFNDNKNKKTEKEIKYLIVAALKNISYEHGAYFFINSNKGRAVLFDKNSFLDTYKDVWNLQDIKGNYIIKRQSNIAQVQAEGFINNYFKKPNQSNDKQYAKISFIKLFEPYDWHIGMGEYIDEITVDSKNEILEYISSLRFGKDGYIFVNSMDKKALVFDGRKLSPPKDYPNDILFQKQTDTVKNKDGDFFFYKFKKLNTIKEYPKLAFVKKYDNWGWIIGAGVYIDEIDNELAKKESQITNVIISQTITILIIFFIILIIIFFVSKKITSYIESNILNLLQLFKASSYSLEEIDVSKFTFKEFKTIAKSLNRTLRLRNKAEKKVNDLMDIINKNVNISTTDTKGKIIDVNDSFCKLSGFSKKELLGKSHNIVRHPDTPKEIYKQMWESLSNGIKWDGELKNIKKNGDTYWVYITIHPNYQNEKLVGYTAIRQDITDKKRVEYLSITDELTQTYNRRYFNTKIEEEINRAKRNDYYLGFLMLDIDYFKFYNDTYGHQAGDIALEKIATILKSHTSRASDFAFRLGGEEFGILFSYKDEEESLNYANLIRSEIEGLKIEHKTSAVTPFITASFGLVVRKGEDIQSVHMIYKLADEALYNAKAGGRNKVFVSN